jgi:hypothetical protein
MKRIQRLLINRGWLRHQRPNGKRPPFVNQSFRLADQCVIVTEHKEKISGKRRHDIA